MYDDAVLSAMKTVCYAPSVINGAISLSKKKVNTQPTTASVVTMES